MRVLKVARAHVGAVVLGGAVLVGAAAGTAAIALTPTSSSAEEVFQAPAAVAEPVATDAPEAPEAVVVENPAPVVAEAPVEALPADNVEVVTAPEAPAPADTYNGVGTTGENGNYTPAPARQNPGEPQEVEGPRLTPAEPLPGEPGYVPPTN